MRKKLTLKMTSIIIIIIFTISLTVIPVGANTKKVIIGGEPFGLKLYCKGVMVTKFEEFSAEYNGINRKVCPAKKSGLAENDIITEVNGITVNSNEQLGNIIANSKGENLKFKIYRDGEYLLLNTTPIKNSNKLYCIGVWVRDSCAGIGTITYYNPKSKTYGALGHGICDIDSGGLMYSDNIEILSSSISSVSKSQANNIGTLNGYFTSDVLAKVGYNNNLGIYGKIINIPIKKEIQVAEKTELEPGNASIYSTIEGNQPKEYKIKITQICNYDENTNQNFVLQITDKELLNKTGGIVQGMSGSPIIQGEKIVGAITHVMINDPTKGYGIHIKNMLNCENEIK